MIIKYKLLAPCLIILPLLLSCEGFNSKTLSEEDNSQNKFEIVKLADPNKFLLLKKDNGQVWRCNIDNESINECSSIIFKNINKSNKLSEEDKKAYDWAKSNPQDPRAKEILELLNVHHDKPKTASKFENMSDEELMKLAEDYFEKEGKNKNEPVDMEDLKRRLKERFGE